MLGLGDAPDLTGGASRRASASSFQPLGDTQSLMGGGRAAAADPLEDSDMNTDELGMGLDAILGGETVVGGAETVVATAVIASGTSTDSEGESMPGIVSGSSSPSPLPSVVSGGGTRVWSTFSPQKRNAPSLCTACSTMDW